LSFMQIAHATCADLSSNIERNLKLAALQSIKPYTNDTVEKGSLRQQSYAGAMIQVQILVTQALAAKCPLGEEPLTSEKYHHDANACVSAMINNDKPYMPDECVQKKWKSAPIE